MPHPSSFCPTCAPSLSLWLAGIPGSPGSSREQTGSECQDSPRPAASPPPAGVRATRGLPAISPPRDRRTRAEGLGTSDRGVIARPGCTPALRALAHPTPAVGPQAGPSPGPAPLPRGRLAQRLRASEGARRRMARAPLVTRGPEPGGAACRRAGAGLTPRGCRRCRSPTC